jgi:hypothetical protein
MITSRVEYEKAREELDHLQKWLEELRRANPVHEKGLTKAGVRKMIARLQEEIGFFEGSGMEEELLSSPQPEEAPMK